MGVLYNPEFPELSDRRTTTRQVVGPSVFDGAYVCRGRASEPFALTRGKTESVGRSGPLLLLLLFPV
jgi:hypothetical protein